MGNSPRLFAQSASLYLVAVQLSGRLLRILTEFYCGIFSHKWYVMEFYSSTSVKGKCQYSGSDETSQLQFVVADMAR